MARLAPLGVARRAWRAFKHCVHCGRLCCHLPAAGAGPRPDVRYAGSLTNRRRAARPGQARTLAENLSLHPAGLRLRLVVAYTVDFVIAKFALTCSLAQPDRRVGRVLTGCVRGRPGEHLRADARLSRWFRTGSQTASPLDMAERVDPYHVLVLPHAAESSGRSCPAVAR